MIPDRITNEIVTLAVPAEVFLSIVDDMVRADLTNQVQIAVAADAGDFGSI